MNASELYGKTFICECGKEHSITPRRVVYESGIAARVGEEAAELTTGRRAVMLSDVRTFAACGEAVLVFLRQSGWDVIDYRVADLPGGHSPVCDDVTRERLEQDIAEVDLIVPVGSGVINDLGKWLAQDRDLPYLTVATAASMNGYTSANIAVTLKGVKTVLWAKPPEIILADPDIIAGAPFEMTTSGLGDVLAKSVSSADWRMNHIIWGDYYCPRSVNLIADIEPLYFDKPEAIRNCEPRAMEALFQALLLTGVAMTMVGSSFPASGGEHLISHTLDMMAMSEGADHDLHGRQVGVGTILASELYNRVLALESPVFADELPDIDAGFWGKLAPEVKAAYGEKPLRLREAAQKLRQGNAWDNLRAELSPMTRNAESLRNCLRYAGAATCADDIGVSADRLKAALLHAREIRDRFTILDLAWMTGVLPGAAEEILGI